MSPGELKGLSVGSGPAVEATEEEMASLESGKETPTAALGWCSLANHFGLSSR